MPDKGKSNNSIVNVPSVQVYKVKDINTKKINVGYVIGNFSYSNHYC